MTVTNHVLESVANDIATLTINRPEARNATSPDMLKSIASFLGRIADDASVRCVVIRANGENFIAGGDVGSFAPSLTMSRPERAAYFEQRVAAALPLYESLEHMPKPVVVVARGAIAGAGIAIALAADLTLVSDTAFYFFAHGHLGLSLDGALSYYLPRAVGMRKARELALLNARVEAREALALGLANRVFADSQLDAEADALIAKLALGATVAMGETKRLIEQSLRHGMKEQFQAEAISCGRSVATADFEAGVEAFLAKRKPAFVGR